MVLSAVLRDLARDPEQAHRRLRARACDRVARLLAMARYVAGALGELPAAVPAVFTSLLHRRDRAWLSRVAGAVRRLCDRGANSDHLLFRLHLGHLADPRLGRNNETAAEFDL